MNGSARCLMLAALAAATACSRNVAESRSFAAGCVLDTAVTVRCDACLDMEHEVRLGEVDGPGHLFPGGGIESVVRDRVGNYWIGQGQWINVYRPDGTFMSTVGREGEGPLEFRYARPIHLDRSDRVHIFDEVNMRVSEVDELHRLAAEKRLPGAATISSIAPLDDGRRYAVQAWIPTPELLGLPIHVVEGQDIVVSFGSPGSDWSGEDGFASQTGARRHLATDDGNNIFAARYYDYIVDAWSEHGMPVGRLEGLPELDDGLRGLRNTPAQDNPPWNELVDIRVDAESFLWVLLRFRRQDWSDNSVEMVYPDGGVAIAPANMDPTKWYRSRIEVVDLATCSLVASEWHEEFFVGFVGNDMMAAGESSQAGVPYVNIYRTSFRKVPPRTGTSARGGGNSPMSISVVLN